MSESRNFAAIPLGAVVGYSRLAGADAKGMVVRLRGLRSDRIDPAIAARHERIAKRADDGSIVEYRSVARPA